MTMEMNITENSDRWPTKSVAAPTDQQRLRASTISMTIGLPARAKATIRSPSVRAKARMVAFSLSSKAAVISSVASAGLPVTPTLTPGNSARRAAMTSRIDSTARRSPVKLPRSVSGSARMKSSRWSSDRKYPALDSSPSTAKSPPHGER